MVWLKNQGLRRTNKYFTARFMAGSNKNAKKGIDSLADRLLGKYIGAVLTVEKKLSGWALK